MVCLLTAVGASLWLWKGAKALSKVFSACLRTSTNFGLEPD